MQSISKHKIFCKCSPCSPHLPKGAPSAGEVFASLHSTVPSSLCQRRGFCSFVGVRQILCAVHASIVIYSHTVPRSILLACQSSNPYIFYQFLSHRAVIQPTIFALLQVQSSPRLAVLLRSPKVAWHRLQWRGRGEQARIVTKWELNSYKSELIPSPGNSIFGKATASPTYQSRSHGSQNSNESNGKTAGVMECPQYPQESKTTTDEPHDLVIDEEEECKVQ